MARIATVAIGAQCAAGFISVLSAAPISVSAERTEPIELRAGPLSMIFSPQDAFLRYIKVGDYEVWRGINAPVRDRTWGTVRPQVDDILLDDRGDSFTLTFDVVCSQSEIDFFWNGMIEGSSDGTLTFRFDGEARSTFLRNRIGFCLLHGPQTAGRRCVVETTDGKNVDGAFPEFISPHQPFMNIRAISHEVAPGLWARVRFDGEVFEMEDQRNWTDASFKTYCTPLGLPFPVKVEKATKVVQSVEFKLEGDLANLANSQTAADRPIRLALRKESDAKQPLPRIGLQLSSQVAELTDAELNRLKALQLDHLRVDVRTSDAGYPEILRRAGAQARALGIVLHVGVHVSDRADRELEALAAEAKKMQLPVAFWLAFPNDDATVRLARGRLGPVVAAAKIGTGDNTNFTELNRTRPDVGLLDLVSYAINPQVHAFDDDSLVETLAIQGDTVRSARQFIGDLPLVISPITLKPQNRETIPLEHELPPDADTRQPTLFAAGWTLGSIKYLAEAGVRSVTYFETAGCKGIMETDAGTPFPKQFPSRPGSVFPVYHVLRDIGEFAGASVRPVDSSDQLSAHALAVETGDAMRLLVANMKKRPLRVSIDELPAAVQVRHLDGEHVRFATVSPEEFRSEPSQRVSVDDGVLALELGPHGIARIDWRR